MPLVTIRLPKVFAYYITRSLPGQPVTYWCGTRYGFLPSKAMGIAHPHRSMANRTAGQLRRHADPETARCIAVDYLMMGKPSHTFSFPD